MLSPKQIKILEWPYTGKRALICDGAVRSGKTSIMSLSFILWAMGNFDKCSFGLCGKTVGRGERNIIQPLLGVSYLQEQFSLEYTRSGHVLTVTRGLRSNQFYVFGGRDESSYMLIQGVTLAGVLLDEVALMPRSFVEQALARCSVAGAKLWFNCNPDVPAHWFRKEWLLKLREKDATHLHFTMNDNPSLSEETRAMYRGMYAGVFKRRYIDGEWTAGDGLIYDMFDPDANSYDDLIRPKGLSYIATRTIACDYGTANPTVFLDIYDDGGIVWVDREYRWDSRDVDTTGLRQKTDWEYADDLATFMGEALVHGIEGQTPALTGSHCFLEQISLPASPENQASPRPLLRLGSPDNRPVRGPDSRERISTKATVKIDCYCFSHYYLPGRLFQAVPAWPWAMNLFP